MDMILELIAELLMASKSGMLILVGLLIIVILGVIAFAIYAGLHPDTVKVALNIKETIWNT